MARTYDQQQHPTDPPPRHATTSKPHQPHPTTPPPLQVSASELDALLAEAERVDLCLKEGGKGQQDVGQEEEEEQDGDGDVQQGDVEMASAAAK